jgi:predicted nucleotidyltransferase
VDQPELLKFTIRALERLKIPYAIVGSFASGVWGESRFTQDIDILVELKPNDVPLLCAAFPETEFYVSQAAANEAVVRHGQFNVINPASGNKIDFMIASNSSWVRAQLERRKRISFFPDQDGSVAAAEDIILGKLVYYHEGGSDKHLRDITGILKFSGDYIDRDYVSRFAGQLGVADIWQGVLSKFQQA